MNGQTPAVWALQARSGSLRALFLKTTCLAAGGLLVALAALGLANGSGREAASPVAETALQRTFASLPLSFEPNRGQASARMRFLARGPGYSTGFARSGLRLRVEDGRRTHSLRVQFEGARPQVLQAAQPLPGRVNYLIGQNRSRWRTNIPTFGQLLARNVYPGIDLLYQGRQGHLRYDFLVAPHADPARIALRFPGVRSLRLARSGDLLLGLPTGKTLRQLRPRAFQEVRGERRAVPSRYVLDGSSVRFALGRYHPHRPLVIDPTLAYSTRLGGSSSDYGHGIAVDAGGSTYVTGRTYSTDFPTMNPFQSTNANAGYDDVFVAKLDAAGTLSYSTYLGGELRDAGFAIAVDSAGSAYVTGQTDSLYFPTKNPFQPSRSGPYDVFVAKLNPAGSDLSYSTYLGGINSDYGYGIAVDAGGSAYVTGSTYSFNFPTQNPAFGYGGGTDAFVAKLDPSGSTLSYSTFLGGSGEDVGEGIAVDAGGSAHVGGPTNSTDFPTSSPFQPANGGNTDAFVAKLNPAGSALSYSTYLGGTHDDRGHGIAIDSAGSAYLAGQTNSPNFPNKSAFQTTYAGGNDAFLTKLDATGALSYSTFLGGPGFQGNDYGAAIAVDSAGSASLTGWTTSTSFPTKNPFQGAHGGGTDAFLTKLTPSGDALVYSSYLGGSANDGGAAIAVDASGAAYIAGSTDSPSFSAEAPSQPTAVSIDAFAAKVSSSPTAASLVSFTAQRVGRRAILRWRTGSEAALAGFNLFRGPAKLNRTLIPAAGRAWGSFYVFRDWSTRGLVLYRLEGISLDGARVQLGRTRLR